MKNKNLLIIGAVVIAAFFFFKKKKTVAILPLPPSPILPPVDNKFPIDMLPNKATYPGGLTEGMRVLADNGVEQQILQDGKIYGLTLAQWAERGYDAPTIVSSNILDQIPYGGVYNSGL
jgi:hypothetical protein